MSKFPHGGDALGAQPGHLLLAPVLRPEMVLSRQQALIDLQAIQRIPGLVGYWSADPAYLFEDSGATTPATLNGVVGCWTSVGPAALQATTAVKPYLRKTPVSNVYWLGSNTATSALTATLGNLGSACTVAQAGAEGVAFTENVTISSTYNIAPAYGFNGDVAIFNRTLTVSEKALLTRYMQRGVPVLGPELVYNGGFDYGTEGWINDNGILSVVDGEGISTQNGNSNLVNRQTFVLPEGGMYIYSGRYRRGTSTGIIKLNLYSNPGFVAQGNTLANGTTNWYRGTAVFISSQNGVYLFFSNGDLTLGNTAYFDDISLKGIM